MKTIFLFASITVASGLLLANIYTSIIDARSWGSHIPESIATARDYYKTVNPGDFFRLFSPLNQALGILVLVLCWKTLPEARQWLSLALLMYLVAEGLTFGYFYPRNAILFSTAPLTDIHLLTETWKQWSTMNWVRSGILLAGIIFSFRALHVLYKMPA